MKQKKHTEVYNSLLEYVKSFGAYSHIASLHELSDADIETFAKMFYLNLGSVKRK